MPKLSSDSRLRSPLKCPALFSRWGVFFLLILGTGWVFEDLPSFQPLLYDDPEYLAGRPEGFGLDYWKDLWTSAVVNLWHPLTVLSHDLVSRFGGNSPWRHHLVNVLLHLGVGLAVIYWLRGLAWSLVASVTIAAVWMFHPCLVESVAWVSGRKDLLSGLFIVISLGAAARGRPGWLVCLFGIAALLAKPVAIVLPAVLIIQDLAIRRKSLWDPSEWRGLFQRHAALAVSAVAVVLVTLSFQGEGGQAIADPRGVIERLAAAGWGLWRALSLWFWPVGLHTAYDDPEILPLGFSLFAFGVIGLSAWGMCSVRMGLTWRVSLALFLFFLLPTLGFIRAGNHIVADRYLYLPGLGLTLIAVHGLVSFRHWALIATVFLATMLGWLTKTQRKHWITTRALFERALEVEPHHSYALAKIGTLERLDGRLASAKKYYEASLEQNPRSPDAHRNLAEIALENDDHQSAYHHYLELAQTWRREVWLYERLAKLAFNLDQREVALEHLAKAMSVTSEAPERDRLEQLQLEMQAR